MERYEVSFTADLIIQIDAASPEIAKAIVVQAFNRDNAFDPLIGKTFSIDGAEAEIKTTIIQDWDVSEICVERV